MAKDMLQPFQEDFKLMVEAGFMAVKQLNEDHAKKLFNAAQLLRPDDVNPQIGLGYIHLNKMEHKPAVEIFSKVCEKESENYLAQAFLGMAYLLSKKTNDKGEELLKDAKQKSDNPTVANLADVSLEWNRKDLKNTKAPFFDEE
ncbi:MAG: tetratricopeptide repeat protein [Chlamydiota bacterium]